jgi:hypothetical protein
VYWIAPAADAGEDAAGAAPGTPIRAYCDMQLGQDICDQNLGTHTGQMRDGSEIAYEMSSVLDASVCAFSDLRGATNGAPFILTVNMCGVMGFASGDPSSPTSCVFGPQGDDACGYSVTDCPLNPDAGTDAGAGWDAFLTFPAPYYRVACVKSTSIMAGGTCGVVP